MQDAIELNATASLVNANSYALYAACEWAFYLFFSASSIQMACAASDSGVI